MGSRRLALGWRFDLAGLLAISGVIVLVSDRAVAQITPDATLGTENSVITPNVSIGGLAATEINGGAVRGANLFHSFQEFNIGNGQRVYFANPMGIENILSRVSGTDPSDILGTLGVNGNANLFLLNPNGIIFGQNARLDVRGSFVASTANAIQFGDRGFFSASTPDVPSPLLTVNPSAFLFNQITAQSAKPIVNQSRVNPDAMGLQVPVGRSLLLLGGDVRLQGGRMQAPGGRIELGGLVGSGVVRLAIDGGMMSLSFPEGIARANVSLTSRNNNGARVNVAASDGGSIGITAQDLEILGGSSLNAGIVRSLGTANSQAGDITLDVTGAIAIANSQIRNQLGNRAVGQGGNITIQAGSVSMTDTAQQAGRTRISTNVENGAIGKGGDIVIDTGSLSVTDEARISSNMNGRGDAGNIFVNADGAVEILEGDIVSEVGREAIGKGGNIQIQAESLELNGRDTNGARLSTEVLGQGRGGNIFVRVQEGVTLLNGGRIRTRLAAPAIGSSGDIEVEARSLFMDNGGRLEASTLGEGKAGNIQVNASDSVIISGNYDYTTSAGINTGTETGAEGEGGNITVKTNILSMSENTALNSRSRSAYRGGDITLDVNRLEMTGGSQLLSTAFSSGDAGKITVNATHSITLSGTDPTYFERLTNRSPELVANDTSTSGLLARTQGVGNGGNISITTGQLTIQDGAILNSQSTGQGRAGNVTINANEVELAGGGQIITSAFSSGSAGDIMINAPESVILSGSDPTFGERLAELGVERVGNDSPASGVFARTQGSGAAGTMTINTGQLRVQEGAQLSASTSSTGGSGSIIVRNAELIAVSNNSSISIAVNAGAIVRAAELTGNIDLQTRSLSLTNDAELKANTSGQGNAGSIVVRDADSVFLSNSSISTAVNFGAIGQGGNIDIQTQTLWLDKGAQISASTFGQGNAGNVFITANTVDVTNGGQLLTTTGSNEDAGNISLVVGDRVTLVGAGSGLFANTTSSSTGNGGSIFIDPQIVSLQDGARIAVDSQGTGEGGDIEIQATRLTLEDSAFISAETQSNTGGNITLRVADFLLLRHGSKISTTAGNAQAGGDGGNIAINTQFILAVPEENSDITANAFEGQGGSINITAQGLFGIEFREELTPLSDITASSRFGIDGTVTINRPDVDPSRGLAHLPTDLVDGSNQIAQNCPLGGLIAQNRFSVTGRGGLPANPYEFLSSDTIWTDLRLNLRAMGESREWESDSKNSSSHSFPEPPRQIVEASRWVRGSKGEIILTAYAPTVSPHSLWLKSPSCRGFQTGTH